MNKPRGLGKGLGAIFQEKREAHTQDLVEEENRPTTEIELDLIDPNPFQPRKEFQPEELQELAASIRERGIIQPILVRNHGERYQIIAGERRFRATQSLGWKAIPALVRERVSDREMREVALIENIQRVQLNAIEEAMAYQELLTECGLTHDELATRVGKSRSAITNAIRLLRLQEDVRNLVLNGKLSAGHARALATLEPDRQVTLAQRALEEDWSVRHLERFAGDASEKRPAPKKAKPGLTPEIQAYIENLERSLGTRIELKADAKGKGVLQVHCFNWDDLQRLGDIIFRGMQG